MKQATLLFLLEDKRILLAMKKRGFGVGRWNGVGGKPIVGETVGEAAKRECEEEIGVKALTITEVATLNFKFPSQKKHLDQEVVVFTCNSWSGEPIETEEMAPRWFNKEDVPFHQMWKGDKYWLPKIITGMHVTGDFLFDDNDDLVNHSVDIIQV